MEPSFVNEWERTKESLKEDINAFLWLRLPAETKLGDADYLAVRIFEMIFDLGENGKVPFDRDSDMQCTPAQNTDNLAEEYPRRVEDEPESKIFFVESQTLVAEMQRRGWSPRQIENEFNSAVTSSDPAKKLAQFREMRSRLQNEWENMKNYPAGYPWGSPRQG